MNQAELQHTIDFQLKQPIAMLIHRRYYRAALVLIYSGIDAMGNLTRGIEEREDDSRDFMRWVKNYLEIQGEHQTLITPEEWWSSRCGLIHTQTYLSRDVMNGKCRIITFMNWLRNPTIQFNSSIDKNQIIVSTPALAEAFLVGVDKTMHGLQQNASLTSVAEARLRNLYINVSVEPVKISS